MKALVAIPEAKTMAVEKRSRAWPARSSLTQQDISHPNKPIGPCRMVTIVTPAYINGLNLLFLCSGACSVEADKTRQEVEVAN